MIWMTSQRDRCGMQTPLEGRECLRVSNGGPGIVGRPSQMARNGRESLPEGREW